MGNGWSCNKCDRFYLGGNDFATIVQDAFKGAFWGAVLGCVITTLTFYTMIGSITMLALNVFRGVSLVLGGIGVYISCKEEHYMQAVFRGILALVSYRFLGKLIDGVKAYRLDIGSYLAGKAPNQVSPGTRFLEGQYINDQGRVEPWKAYYDEFGRLIARTDYNAGNRAAGIPDVHYHLYEWGPGKLPLEYKSHVEGEFME